MVVKRVKQKQISFGYCDTTSGQRVYPPPEDPTSNIPEESPPQKKPACYPEELDHTMYAKVTCWPPLGQASTIARDQHAVRFTVLLETTAPSEIEQEQPQVCIWHDHGGHFDWAELALKPTTECDDVLLLNRPRDRSIARRWYTAELSGNPKHGQKMSFTVKFLIRKDHGWRWAKDTSGIEDGELNYQGTDWNKHLSYDLNHWFSGMSGDIQVRSERPDTDDTFLYSLTAPVGPADGQESGWQYHQMGMPNHSTRWFSLVRLWSPWLAPRQGKGKFDVEKDAVLVSFLRSDGLHVVLLAVSGVDDVLTTLFNDEHGNIIVKGRNDRQDIGTSRVLVAVADSFDVANAAVFYHARKVIGSYGAADADAEIKDLMATVQPEDNPKPEWLEEWYDGLTYCTWNGLGQDLTAQKIYDALDELASENVNITNLIIDDNWQDLSEGDSQFKRGWIGFEANKKGFPDGMQETTRQIRQRHPNIKHIAVWHALLGYWGCIDPNGWIAKNYKTIEVQLEPGVVTDVKAGGKFTIVAAEDAHRMYADFYKFLVESGIDSVKTDAQCFIDMLHHAPDRRSLTKTYQDAWTIAHLRHFSSRAISCMSQFPQMIFHTQLPRNKPRVLLRNSDDFFPEVSASHPWHIFCNAHNSLLTQHLNILPDWDMFQTSHEWASFHAAARCVSGGPIYFTDRPGQHDIELIRQMTAQTPRDKTVILRPQVIGKAMNPYNAYKDLALLKVGTYVGFAQTGAGILGVFNVSDQYISEFIGLSDIPGTEKGEYVIGSFVSGRIGNPVSQKSVSAMAGLELETHGWDILTAYAVKEFTLKSSETPVKVGMMGLLYKMTGAAAVTGYDIYIEDNGRLRIWTSLKALGVLGIYISELAQKEIGRDFMVMIYGKPIPVGCVRKSEKVGSGNVLEVDVERAWKESGEKAGWSNEVTMEIFMH